MCVSISTNTVLCGYDLMSLKMTLVTGNCINPSKILTAFPPSFPIRFLDFTKQHQRSVANTTCSNKLGLVSLGRSYFSDTLLSMRNLASKCQFPLLAWKGMNIRNTVTQSSWSKQEISEKVEAFWEHFISTKNARILMVVNLVVYLFSQKSTIQLADIVCVGSMY